MESTKRYDKRATVNNTKRMLEQYRYYVQFSRQLPLPNKIPIPQADYKHMNYLARQQFARCFCSTIDNAINALADKISRQLVREIYIKPFSKQKDICKRLKMRKSTFDYKRDNALFELATKCNGMPVISMDHSIKYQSLLVDKQLPVVNR